MRACFFILPMRSSMSTPISEFTAFLSALSDSLNFGSYQPSFGGRIMSESSCTPHVCPISCLGSDAYLPHARRHLNIVL